MFKFLLFIIPLLLFAGQAEAKTGFKIINDNTLVMFENGQQKKFEIEITYWGNPDIYLGPFDNKPALIYLNRSVDKYKAYLTLSMKNNQLFMDCYYLDLWSGYASIVTKQFQCGINQPLHLEGNSYITVKKGIISGRFSLYQPYSFIQTKTLIDAAIKRQGDIYIFLRYTPEQLNDEQALTIVYDNHNRTFFTETRLNYVDIDPSATPSLYIIQIKDDAEVLEKVDITADKMTPISDSELGIKRLKRDSVIYRRMYSNEPLLATEDTLAAGEIVFLLNVEPHDGFCDTLYLTPDNKASDQWIKCDDIAGAEWIAPEADNEEQTDCG